MVTHHLLGGDGGLDAADGAVVDVHVQGEALEAAEDQHQRDGKHTGEDHRGRYAKHPARVRGLLYSTLSGFIINLFIPLLHISLKIGIYRADYYRG